jgi:hypothetical protein
LSIRIFAKFNANKPVISIIFYLLEILRNYPSGQFVACQNDKKPESIFWPMVKMPTNLNELTVYIFNPRKLPSKPDKTLLLYPGC